MLVSLFLWLLVNIQHKANKDGNKYWLQPCTGHGHPQHGGDSKQRDDSRTMQILKVNKVAHQLRPFLLSAFCCYINSLRNSVLHVSHLCSVIRCDLSDFWRNCPKLYCLHETWSGQSLVRWQCLWCLQCSHRLQLICICVECQHWEHRKLGPIAGLSVNLRPV